MIKRKGLLNLMKKHGYTAQSLAEELNVSNWLIYKWLYGKSEPNVATLIKLMTIFEVSGEEVLWLFCEEE